MDVATVLNAKEGIEKVMGDILRVLYLYRRLWLTEVYMEVEGMNYTLKDKVPEYDDIVNAARELWRSGFIQLDKGLRSSLSQNSGVEDYLVTLNDDSEILRALAIDRKLIEYITIRYSLLEIR